MTIFILEDSRSLFLSLEKQLSEKGFQVTGAGSWESVRPLLTRNFDVFIIDFLLPDASGADVIEKISNHANGAGSCFILTSGMFSAQDVMGALPEALQQKTIFLKKPLSIEDIVQAIQKLKPDGDALTLSQIHIKDLKNSDWSRAYEGPRLIKVMLSLNRDTFTGALALQFVEGKSGYVSFQNGNIVQVQTEGSKSYFGELLIKHGFSFTEEVKDALHSSNEKIGRTLIRKGRLSPHIASFILKEQAKLRLSEWVLAPSFKMKIENRSMEEESWEMMECGLQDILDWAVECIQTKLSSKYLNQFYMTCMEKTPQLGLPLPSGASEKTKDFIEKCKSLLSLSQGEPSLQRLLEKSGLDPEDFSRLIYFAHSADALKFSGGRKLNKISDLADMFLKSEAQSLFDVLQVPSSASGFEIQEKYKSLVKDLHPDHLPVHADSDLQNKCGAAMQMINEAYEILADDKKRADYLEAREQEMWSQAISLYEEGLEFLKMKNYSAALQAFKSVQRSASPPKNISLYVIWAEIKHAAPLDMIKPEKAGSIMQKINDCPLELKTSALFWFVNGLFYSYSQQYKKAVFFFRKTLQQDNAFAAASQELFQTLKKAQEDVKKKKKKICFSKALWS